jgi:hypothetical protein
MVESNNQQSVFITAEKGKNPVAQKNKTPERIAAEIKEAKKLAAKKKAEKN